MNLTPREIMFELRALQLAHLGELDVTEEAEEVDAARAAHVAELCALPPPPPPPGFAALDMLYAGLLSGAPAEPSFEQQEHAAGRPKEQPAKQGFGGGAMRRRRRSATVPLANRWWLPLCSRRHAGRAARDDLHARRHAAMLNRLMW